MADNFIPFQTVDSLSDEEDLLSFVKKHGFRALLEKESVPEFLLPDGGFHFEEEGMPLVSHDPLCLETESGQVIRGWGHAVGRDRLGRVLRTLPSHVLVLQHHIDYEELLL